MEYFVIGADGKEYGPADFDTLMKWAVENRINPSTQLREKDSGLVVAASAVPGLVAAPPGAVIEPVAQHAPVQNWSQPPSYVPAPSRPSVDDSPSVLIGVVWRSAAALVLFFVLGGLGLIFAGYAMYHAVQVKSSGSRHGTLALVIGGVSLAAVVVGWIVRLTTGAV